MALSQLIIFGLLVLNLERVVAAAISSSVDSAAPAPSWLPRKSYYECRVSATDPNNRQGNIVLHILQPEADYTKQPSASGSGSSWDTCRNNLNGLRPFELLTVQQAQYLEEGSGQLCVDAAFDHFGRHAETNETLVAAHDLAAWDGNHKYFTFTPSAYLQPGKKQINKGPTDFSLRTSRYVCTFISLLGTCTAAGQTNYLYFKKENSNCPAGSAASPTSPDPCQPSNHNLVSQARAPTSLFGGFGFSLYGGFGDFGRPSYYATAARGSCRVTATNSGWHLPPKSSSTGLIRHFLLLRSRSPMSADFSWAPPATDRLTDSVQFKCTLELLEAGPTKNDILTRWGTSDLTWTFTEWSRKGDNSGQVFHTVTVPWSPVSVNCTATPRYVDGTLGEESDFTVTALGLHRYLYTPRLHPDAYFYRIDAPQMYCRAHSSHRFKRDFFYRDIALAQWLRLVAKGDNATLLYHIKGYALRNVPPLHRFIMPDFTMSDPFNPDRYPAHFHFEVTGVYDYSSPQLTIYGFNPATMNGTILRCSHRSSVYQQETIMTKYHKVYLSVGETYRHPQACLDGTGGAASTTDNHWWHFSASDVATKAVLSTPGSKAPFLYESEFRGTFEYLTVNGFRASDNGTGVYCFRDSLMTYLTGRSTTQRFAISAHAVYFYLRGPPKPLLSLTKHGIPSASRLQLQYMLPANTTFQGVQVTCSGVRFQNNLRTAHSTTVNHANLNEPIIELAVRPSFTYKCYGKVYHYKAMSSTVATQDIPMPKRELLGHSTGQRLVLPQPCRYPNTLYNMKTGLPYPVEANPFFSASGDIWSSTRNFEVWHNGTDVRCGTKRDTEYELVFVAWIPCPSYTFPALSRTPGRSEVIYNGSSLRVDCNPRARLVGGPAVVQCNNGSLSHTPDCLEIVCPKYPYNATYLVNRTALTQAKFSIGANLQFDCYGSPQYASCQVDPVTGNGSWTRPADCVQPDLCSIPVEKAKCGKATCQFIRSNHTVRCVCAAGYRFDSYSQSCQDIDECALGVCNDVFSVVANTGCRNTPGSYECVCRKGFRTDPTTANKFNFTCSDKCVYDVTNFGRITVSRGRTESFTCPLGHMPTAFTLRCGSNSEVSKSYLRLCAPSDCPATFGVDPHVSFAQPVTSLGAVTSLTCPRSKALATYFPAQASDHARVQCSATTARPAINNVWTFQTGAVYRSAFDVACTDYCEYTANIPKGVIGRTRLNSNLNITCDLGYELEWTNGPVQCNKTTSGFAAVTLNADGSFPFTCKFADPCAPNKNVCPSDSRCVRNQLEVTCECNNAGYYFDRITKTCKDKDECQLFTQNPKLVNCSVHATCTNSLGSYQCRCAPHYSGNGRTCSRIQYCTDANLNTCVKNATCSLSLQAPAGHVCQCPLGSRLPHCWDIDECAEDRTTTGSSLCPASNSECVNTNPRYICRCRRGFALNTSSTSTPECADIDECRGYTGCDQSTEMCQNTVGNFSCGCRGGFSRKTVGGPCTDDDECQLAASNNCSQKANSDCVNQNGGYKCKCRRGFSASPDGGSCLDINECKRGTHTCNPTQGMCHNTVGHYTCSCRSGFTGNGTSCDDEDECKIGRSGCDSNALCINLQGGHKCQCRAGYTGDGWTCSNVDECASAADNGCSAYATCADTTGSYTCTCQAGYTGDGERCTNVNECQTVGACSLLANCTDSVGSYSCKCVPGFTGNGRTCQDIDECSPSSSPGGAGPCGALTTCTNTQGSFACPCGQPQYSRPVRGSSTECQDIDECAESRDRCSPNARCDNTDNGYTCTCNAGFRGDGYNCTDIDECNERLANSCQPPQSVCHNTAGSYSCGCDVGFSLDPVSQTCTNIDECSASPAPCGVHATCHDSQGSYVCPCKSGYVPDPNNTGSCMDEDECATSQPCISATASCTNKAGSFQCSCNSGYSGDGETSCIKIDECTDKNLHGCSVQADCNRDSPTQQFYCRCKSGYTGDGRNCSDINECTSGAHNCLSPSVCINEPSTFKCVCPRGFSGTAEDCSDIDECTAKTHNCTGDSQCKNSPGQFTCACLPGFQAAATGFCEDIDECSAIWVGVGSSSSLSSSSPCPQLSNCNNTQGSYMCACFTGYSLVPTLDDSGTQCVDDDECTSAPGTGGNECSPSATCTNSIGSYACACRDGYQGDGFNCTDADECAAAGTNACSRNATCTNNEGSYSCACKPGYQGSGMECRDVDECDSATLSGCSSEATCTNDVGSYQCTCFAGYTGDGKQCTNVNECAYSTASCSAQGSCVDNVGSYSCVCQNGYQGNGQFCTDIDECQTANASSCHANAECSNNDGSYMCKCHQGYSGNGWQCTEVDECATTGGHSCSKFATCRNTVGSYLCSCSRGYAGNGSFCGDVDECSVVGTCSQHGTCRNTLGSRLCTCQPGYRGNGTTCVDEDECALGRHVCNVAAGKCHNTVGSYECSCARGYEGNGTVCRDTDECIRSPPVCLQTATCSNNIGSYSCTCKPGFHGNHSICHDDNECASGAHDCSERTVCLNTYGSYQCNCQPFYRKEGDKCLLEQPCYTPVQNCTGSEICTVIPASSNLEDAMWNCTCPPGFKSASGHCNLTVVGQAQTEKKDNPTGAASSNSTLYIILGVVAFLALTVMAALLANRAGKRQKAAGPKTDLFIPGGDGLNMTVAAHPYDTFKNRIVEGGKYSELGEGSVGPSEEAAYASIQDLLATLGKRLKDENLNSNSFYARIAHLIQKRDDNAEGANDYSDYIYDDGMDDNDKDLQVMSPGSKRVGLESTSMLSLYGAENTPEDDGEEKWGEEGGPQMSMGDHSAYANIGSQPAGWLPGDDPTAQMLLPSLAKGMKPPTQRPESVDGVDELSIGEEGWDSVDKQEKRRSAASGIVKRLSMKMVRPTKSLDDVAMANAADTAGFASQVGVMDDDEDMTEERGTGYEQDTWGDIAKAAGRGGVSVSSAAIVYSNRATDSGESESVNQSRRASLTSGQASMATGAKPAAAYSNLALMDGDNEVFDDDDLTRPIAAEFIEGRTDEYALISDRAKSDHMMRKAAAVSGGILGKARQDEMAGLEEWTDDKVTTGTSEYANTQLARTSAAVTGTSTGTATRKRTFEENESLRKISGKYIFKANNGAFVPLSSFSIPVDELRLCDYQVVKAPDGSYGLLDARRNEFLASTSVKEIQHACGMSQKAMKAEFEAAAKLTSKDMMPTYRLLRDLFKKPNGEVIFLASDGNPVPISIFGEVDLQTLSKYQVGLDKDRRYALINKINRNLIAVSDHIEESMYQKAGETSLVDNAFDKYAAVSTVAEDEEYSSLDNIYSSLTEASLANLPEAKKAEKRSQLAVMTAAHQTVFRDLDGDFSFVDSSGEVVPISVFETALSEDIASMCTVVPVSAVEVGLYQNNTSQLVATVKQGKIESFIAKRSADALATAGPGGKKKESDYAATCRPIEKTDEGDYIYMSTSGLVVPITAFGFDGDEIEPEEYQLTETNTGTVALFNTATRELVATAEAKNVSHTVTSHAVRTSIMRNRIQKVSTLSPNDIRLGHQAPPTSAASGQEGGDDTYDLVSATEGAQRNSITRVARLFNVGEGETGQTAFETDDPYDLVDPTAISRTASVSSTSQLAQVKSISEMFAAEKPDRPKGEDYDL